jgi:predicted ATPase
VHYDLSFKLLTDLTLEYKALPDDYSFTAFCIKAPTKPAFNSAVTIFVDENGKGKSTLLGTTL